MTRPPLAYFVVVIKRYHAAVALIVVGLIYAKSAADRGQAVWPYWVRKMPSQRRPKRLQPAPSPLRENTHLTAIMRSYQRARIKDALKVLERHSRLPSSSSDPIQSPSPLPPSPSPLLPPAVEPTTRSSRNVLEPSRWMEQALQQIKSSKPLI